MKVIISALIALSATSAFAFDCSHNEAQFIGKVTSVRVHKIDQGIRDCYLKVQFSMFNPSGICPVDQVNAEQNEILDMDCKSQAEVGSAISGILLEGLDGQLVLE